MLDYERAAKTPYELVCLRQASHLGARGHIAAARAFGAGATEFEIQLEFLKATAACAKQELPYNNIIALNEGGAVLHYQVLQRQHPSERRSLLIDAGAEFAGYASDITRTYSFEDRDFAALIAAHGRCAAVALLERACRRRLARHPSFRAPARLPSCCTTRTSSSATPTRPWKRASPACSCRTASGTCWDCRCTTSAD